METHSLKLQGMSCAACAGAIEKAIRNVPGVSECNVNFGMEQATVKYEPQQTSLEEIQQAVTDAGYAAAPVRELG
ncbi:MAG: heavy metal-associated domain-containing protein, partial [Cyanobacteriota bacterium]